MTKLEKLKLDFVKADASFCTARDEHADASEALDDASEYLEEATEAYRSELKKLNSREERGVLGGSGDNR